MLAKLERRPRRVAVLSSESSRVHRASPILAGYYENYQIHHFYTLLNMCHVAADVVFDEGVKEFGLDEYDVLVLPKCDTLIKSVYDRIVEFQNRGGRVIADQYLRAPLKDVTRAEFDFLYRRGVTVNAIRDSMDHVKWGDDHLHQIASEMAKVRGVTAEEDQRTLESYAADLETILKDTVEREFTCNAPTALLNVLEKGTAQYLFVINDKRAYGARFGEHKAMLEDLVPQTVAVTAHNWRRERLFLYDMVERRPLEARSVDGAHVFDVDLSDLGGKIIALLPDRLAEVRCDGPKRIATRGAPVAFTVSVLGENGPLPGVTPVKVELLDPAGEVSEFSDYHAAEEGSLTVRFIAAANDKAGQWTLRAEELLTGKTGETRFNVV